LGLPEGPGNSLGKRPKDIGCYFQKNEIFAQKVGYSRPFFEMELILRKPENPLHNDVCMGTKRTKQPLRLFNSNWLAR